MSLKFYDGWGDTLIIEEDENPYIVDIIIEEDPDDNGNFDKASFTLEKDDALKLVDFLIKKFGNL